MNLCELPGFNLKFPRSVVLPPQVAVELLHRIVEDALRQEELGASLRQPLPVRLAGGQRPRLRALHLPQAGPQVCCSASDPQHAISKG